MAHLAPELINFGHPDVAFKFLSAEGYPSYYQMAKYGGTLWENWSNANGCDTPSGCTNPRISTGVGVGSLNHIMFGGSVGSAVFGLGGIQPPFDSHSTSEKRSSDTPIRITQFSNDEPIKVAPIAWLPEVSRGSVVWRSQAGTVAASWSVSQTGEGDYPPGQYYTAKTDIRETDQHKTTDSPTGWFQWVNVTIPPTAMADVWVILPQSAQPQSVCAWSCGSYSPTFTSEWISFDNSVGHTRISGKLPSPPIPPSKINSTCTPIWRQGVALKNPGASEIGIEDCDGQHCDILSPDLGIGEVKWEPSRPGYTMFPAIRLQTASGMYAIFAQKC